MQTTAYMAYMERKRDLQTQTNTHGPGEGAIRGRATASRCCADKRAQNSRQIDTGRVGDEIAAVKIK